MNAPLVKRLVLKDLYIHRWPILGLAVALPSIALILAIWGGPSWQHMGMILIVNSMIYLSLFLPIATILSEKKPFIFSLPISEVEYTASKVACGLGVFMPPWLVFLVAMPMVVERNENLSAGALVPAVLLLFTFLLSFLATGAVALIFESTLSTTGAGLAIVLVVFGFLPMLEHMPMRLLENWAGDRVVWDPEALGALVLLAALCAAAVLATFVLQRRKTSFV